MQKMDMSVEKVRNHKKTPSLITDDDIDNLLGLAVVLSDTDETFSQSCLRFGSLPDEDADIPADVAIQSFCEDNSLITADLFMSWYQRLLDDEDLFCLDKHTDVLLKEVRLAFDKKMNDWKKEGVLDSNYDTRFVFGAIIMKKINATSYKMGFEELKEEMFYKDPIFGNYKITALDYADDCTLNTFSNPHAYDRYNTEGLFIFAMNGFDEYEDYRKTLVVYQEVKDIVCEDPNRLLADTKKILEAKARKDKKRKHQYAVLYACAVIEYWLKTERVTMP